MQTKAYKSCLRAGMTAALLMLGATLHAETIASVKAMGMGGASVAYGQDSITNYYNPASASFVDCRVDVGGGALWTKQKLRIGNRAATPPGLPSGRFGTKDEWTGFGEAGINAHFGCCCDWSAGVQWNNYENIYAKYKQPLTDFSGAPGISDTGLDYRTEVLTFTGAYKFCESQSFGIGINVYFSWLDVTGLQGIEELELTVDPANLTNRGEDKQTGVGVTLGWLGKFCCDQVSLGFTYSPRVKMGAFKKYKGFLAGNHGFDIPETFRFGAAYNIDACTVLAGDWEFRRYSRVKAWANPFFATSTTGVAAAFGETNGPGFGWEDQWILKLGIESQLTDCLTARFGYRHENSPIRHHGSTDTALNVLTQKVCQNFVSGGATWSLGSCSELSGYLEVGAHNECRSAFPTVTAVEGTLWSSAKLFFEQATVSLGVAYGHRF